GFNPFPPKELSSEVGSNKLTQSSLPCHAEYPFGMQNCIIQSSYASGNGVHHLELNYFISIKPYQFIIIFSKISKLLYQNQIFCLYNGFSKFNMARLART
ncbi:hypothetical protein ACJX0J_019450, partial [Zea mays]